MFRRKNNMHSTTEPPDIVRYTLKSDPFEHCGNGTTEHHRASNCSALISSKKLFFFIFIAVGFVGFFNNKKKIGL